MSLQGEFQRKLYKELVKNYNPLERPVANDSQPLTVYFSLSLLQIMDVVSPRAAARLSSPRRGLPGVVEAGGVAWPTLAGPGPGGPCFNPHRPARCCVPQSPLLPRRNREAVPPPQPPAPGTSVPPVSQLRNSGRKYPQPGMSKNRVQLVRLQPHIRNKCRHAV